MPDKADLPARSRFLVKALPLIAFTVPFLILYTLYPASYGLTWKGRTFYLFFLWLALLEIILNWEKIPETKIRKLKSTRTWAFVAVVALPILYVVAANYWGLNNAILDFGRNNNISSSVLEFLPLSTEYLVLTVFFAFIVTVYYGVDQLGNFSISTFFLGIIGMVYTIDNLYPWGRFTPFQILVPTTTMLAAGVLGLMGFGTSISFSNDPGMGSLTLLRVWASNGKSAAFDIAWPCSGVESLLIYSVTILLFLKNSSISWKQRIVYFVFGGAVTYFINALRIVTIFMIAINGGDVGLFHNYYGQLYSLFWIMSYPLIIMGSRALWGRIVTPKVDLEKASRRSRPVESLARDVF
jgi:thaumarchaeosortase